MTDINNIKNVLFFLPYLKKDTWYVIGTLILVYIIYLAFLMISERYYRAKLAIPMESEEDIKESFLKKLGILKENDPDFFEKLSRILRSYLERCYIVENGLKKTHAEILEKVRSELLRQIFDTCTLYEYAPKESTQEQKLSLKELARKYING